MKMPVESDADIRFDRMDLLMCDINGATVDYRSHVVRLYLPPDHCTDFRGAIEFCRRLDPAVRQIQVECSGNRRSYLYEREGEEWFARGDLAAGRRWSDNSWK